MRGVLVSQTVSKGCEFMLEIKNLSASYDGTAVLSGLNLVVNDGEICTIVGPSGCGKSTLIKAVAGLLTHDAGEILFNDSIVSPKAHTIGYIPQNYGLLPWKTVEQNLILALKVKGLPMMKEGVNVVDSALARVGLLSHKKKYPNGLSGGQRQRVSIARAFLLEPDILLMDEPFSALDTMTKEEMQQFFLDIWRGRSGSTLFITHDIEEAVVLGDKVVVMQQGEKIQIFESPSSDREDEGFVKCCGKIRKLMQEARRHV